MIASTQIKDTEIFAFIAVLVFKLKTYKLTTTVGIWFRALKQILLLFTFFYKQCIFLC